MQSATTEPQTIMHMVTAEEYDAHADGEIGLMTSLCGKSLTYGDGAEDADPLCPECFAVSDWTSDQRKPCPSGETTDLVAVTTRG